MLIIKSTAFDREELLTKLVNASISYISKNRVNDDDNLFSVFDKVLSYFPHLAEKKNIIAKINLFAESG